MSKKRVTRRPQTGSDEADESVGKIWTWCCIPTFVYCLGLWIKTETTRFKPVDMVVESKTLAALAGLIAAPLALFCIWLAMRYANERSALPLPLRTPPPIEKWPRGRLGDRMRIVVVVGVLTVIAGSQVHFIRKVLQGPVYPYGDPHPIAQGYREMLSVWPPGWCCGHKFCFGESKGWTYFPSLESWFFLGLVVAVVLLFFVYLFRDLRIHQYRAARD